MGEGVRAVAAKAGGWLLPLSRPGQVTDVSSGRDQP
jgi:hypothetical protein